MYDYQIIEKNLKTKYVGRVFLQFDEVESTNVKCKNISQECPKGMLILSEEDAEGNLYTEDDLKEFNKNILMSIIFKLKKEDFEKENIETITSYIGASSLIEVGNKYFDNIEYYWEKIIKGENFLCEIDSVKSLKSNDRSIMLGLKVYYKKELKRENLITEITNKIEENFEKIFCDNDLLKVVEICNNCLKNKNKYIKINKKNRKTVKEIKDIYLDDSGRLIGKTKDDIFSIKWKDYDINWCD